MRTLNILNSYAGLGGNRKLWDGNIKVTAVELDPEIAAVYKELYPKDTVIVGDAHEYLLKHFREFDFIWSSPPCQTHSVLRLTFEHNGWASVYPDMRLYQEIIFLKHFFKGKYVIENVKPYYTPLIPPTFKINRHYFWSGDFLMAPGFDCTFTDIRDKPKEMAKLYGFDLDILKKFNPYNKRKVLRNCVNPEIGRYIFDSICNAKGADNHG